MEIKLFAELLGLVEPSSLQSAERDPQIRRRLTLTALIGQLETLTQRGPVLMLFEDVHWAESYDARVADVDNRPPAIPADPPHHHFPS